MNYAPMGLGPLAKRTENRMNAEEKVSWLNAHARPRKWRVGEDVRCRLCGAVFKAERTAMDMVGEPTCPHCITSTTADFEKVLPARKP
jgi:formylmethanofuran dehydrogenase subunit E